MSELPAIEIEGRPYVALLAADDEGPMPEAFAKARMNLSELAALMKALPVEQQKALLFAMGPAGYTEMGQKCADLERQLAEARAQVECAERELTKLSRHPHCAYDGPWHHPVEHITTEHERSYQIGVADGHRCGSRDAEIALLAVRNAKPSPPPPSRDGAECPSCLRVGEHVPGCSRSGRRESGGSDG